MISPTASSSPAPRLTPFEKDTQAYGKAGATLVGGARAVADLAGTQCSFSPNALSRAAAAATEAIEDFGEGVADAASGVVAQATSAYDAVADMAEAVADGVTGLADDVAGYSLTLLSL